MKFSQMLDKKYGKAECTEIVYREFTLIYGRPGYWRYGSRFGGGMTGRHWKTLRGVKAAVDREYK